MSEAKRSRPTARPDAEAPSRRRVASAGLPPEPAADISHGATYGEGGEEDRRLGERVRLLRQERKLSVKALGDLASLSAAMVSQIERGISTPSLRTLRLLGVALGVPMSWFFDAAEASRPLPSPYVVRREARRLLRLTPTGVRKELLSPEHDGRLMEMYALTLAPGGSSGADFYAHAGEKAGLLLSGVLDLWLHEELHSLQEGDSFQFPSHIPHRFANPGPEVARVLWLTTPPAPKRNAP